MLQLDYALDHVTDIAQPRINCSMLPPENLAEPSSTSAYDNKIQASKVYKVMD